MLTSIARVDSVVFFVFHVGGRERGKEPASLSGLYIVVSSEPCPGEPNLGKAGTGRNQEEMGLPLEVQEPNTNEWGIVGTRQSTR